MTDRLRVLVVEDDERDWAEHYAKGFLQYRSLVELVRASTSAEAVTLLEPDFSAFQVIILDGIILSEVTSYKGAAGKATTTSLAERIRGEWDKLKGDGEKRLLVAASSSSAMRRQLVEAGCSSDVVPNDKSEVPRLIARYFRLI
jgi:hypothetical protein